MGRGDGTIDDNNIEAFTRNNKDPKKKDYESQLNKSLKLAEDIDKNSKRHESPNNKDNSYISISDNSLKGTLLRIKSLKKAYKQMINFMNVENNSLSSGAKPKTIKEKIILEKEHIRNNRIDITKEDLEGLQNNRID